MAVFKQISVFSPVLPLILFLFFCLRSSKKELKVIFIYILLSLSVDIFTTATSFGSQHIFLIQAIYSIFEYLLISTFIYLTLANKYFRRIILFASVFFVVATVFNYARLDKTKFDSFGSSLEGILIITYCIMYFFEQISKPATNFIIYASPDFWIVLAFLIYTSATLFLFISTSSLSKDEKNAYWFINILSNILMNVFFSIAFILNKNKPAEEPGIPNDDFFNLPHNTQTP